MARRTGSEKRPRSLWPVIRKIWPIALVLLALNVYLGVRSEHHSHPAQVSYSFFRQQVDAGNVRSVDARADAISGAFRRPVASRPGGGATASFATRRPELGEDGLLRVLVDKGVVVRAQPPVPVRPLWLTLVVSIAPTFILIGLLLLIMRRTAGGGLAGLGRSRARRYRPSDEAVRFEDVAGIDDAKQELMEIVDFLREPARYRRLGAAVPKGVLLSGQPGTGKTLLARAVAGEAHAAFYSLSASEFVEMVAGVGASRVRDLFAKAKQNAPAIVFVDELDAIGRSRGGGSGSGASLDEREQTLNQILTEMDGFTGSEGVIVLAATNRPEVLDSALLRPGRFDRRVVVSPPDRAGRMQILAVHTRKVPLADDVDLRLVARRTPGMVGADLRNLVNEAALVGARRDADAVSLADFDEALERIVLGAQRSITISEDERLRTAYHEAGHALLAMIEPGADPVRKVSIVPRGKALGVTMQSAIDDRHGYDAEDLRGRIVAALGGRAAEQLVFGTATTGAESDLEQVTIVARHMVGRWGMSEPIGLVSVLPRTDAGPADPSNLVSEATRELVDEEVRRMVGECYEHALETITLNRSRLEALARALLANETLDGDAAYAVAGFEPVAEPDLPPNLHLVPPNGNGSASADRPPTRIA